MRFRAGLDGARDSNSVVCRIRGIRGIRDIGSTVLRWYTCQKNRRCRAVASNLPIVNTRVWDGASSAAERTRQDQHDEAMRFLAHRGLGFTRPGN